MGLFVVAMTGDKRQPGEFPAQLTMLIGWKDEIYLPSYAIHADLLPQTPFDRLREQPFWWFGGV